MKFKLQLPRLSTNRQRNSHSRSRRLSYDTGTVETWNELRAIGSEAVIKRYTGKTHPTIDIGQTDDQDEGRSLQEAHDWDFYIAQFNEQYRQQLRDAGYKEGDRDSVSTLAETRSQLLQSRHRRLAVYRRLFVASCLFLWVIFLVAQINWFYMYTVWPIGFLSHTDNSLQAQYFTYKWKWDVFFINCHTWVVGSFGFLCAFCFRERPWLLKQFILRVPYVLLIPTVLVFLAVRFTGTFSTQKLSGVMDTAISRYYDIDDPVVQAESVTNWDQLQKLLQCCGIQLPSDWESVDPDLTDNHSFIPESCCPAEFIRRTWTRERRAKDDCFYKIDKQRFEWTYPDGCLNLAQEFYVKMGAYVVGIMVLKFCGLCLCLCFGKQYYTLINKTIDIHFKYSWRKWFLNIIFLETIINACTRGSKKRSKAIKFAEAEKTGNKSAEEGGFPSVVISETEPKVVTIDLKPGYMGKPPPKRDRNRNVGVSNESEMTSISSISTVPTTTVVNSSVENDETETGNDNLDTDITKSSISTIADPDEPTVATVQQRPNSV